MVSRVDWTVSEGPSSRIHSSSAPNSVEVAALVRSLSASYIKLHAQCYPVLFSLLTFFKVLDKKYARELQGACAGHYGEAHAERRRIFSNVENNH